MLPKQVEKVIKTLKKYGVGDCITIKESVNKDILKTYDEEDDPFSRRNPEKGGYLLV